jgi:hypothetical protein
MIQKNSGDKGFHCISVHGGTGQLTASLTFVVVNERRQSDFAGESSQVFTIDHPTSYFGKESFFFEGKLFKEKFGYDATENGITQIFEPLIVILYFLGSRGMLGCQTVKLDVSGSESRQ